MVDRGLDTRVLGRYGDSTLNWATNASFHIPYNSLSTSYPTTGGYTKGIPENYRMLNIPDNQQLIYVTLIRKIAAGIAQSV